MRKLLKRIGFTGAIIGAALFLANCSDSMDVPPAYPATSHMTMKKGWACAMRVPSSNKKVLGYGRTRKSAMKQAGHMCYKMMKMMKMMSGHCRPIGCRQMTMH